MIATDTTEVIRGHLLDIFEKEPLGVDHRVEYALSFPVLPGPNGGPQVSFLLVLSIPVTLGDDNWISTGRAFPGLRPTRPQVLELVRGILGDLHEEKDKMIQATMASAAESGKLLQGVPRFDLSNGLPPV